MKRQRELKDRFWPIGKRGKLNSFPSLYRSVQAPTPTASKAVGKNLSRLSVTSLREPRERNFNACSVMR